MTSSPRAALRAFALLLLLAPLPLAAQQAATRSGARSARIRPRCRSPRRSSLSRDDPWIYRGTDIPVDREWLFGEMPNGVRYAVRQQPRAAGAGFDPHAHRCRLAARGGRRARLRPPDRAPDLPRIKYLPDGEAIPHFAAARRARSATTPMRSPARRRRSTSSTCPTPATRRSRRASSLLSGMIREPALSDANISAEVPIVLAERRESAAARTRRIIEATSRRLLRRPAAGQSAARSAPSEDAAGRDRATPSRRSTTAGTGPRTPWWSSPATPTRSALAALVEQYFARLEGAGQADAAARLRPAAPRRRGARSRQSGRRDPRAGRARPRRGS